MARGESKYQERVEDIRVLKLEIKRLKQEEVHLVKGTQAIEEMRKVPFCFIILLTHQGSHTGRPSTVPQGFPSPV